MKLKFVAAISGLVAMSALAQAQHDSPQPNIPKPTKTDVQNVVQIVTTDKAKSQAYCDLSKLSDKIEAAGQKNDAKIVETLAKQTDALTAKLGPEYSKLIDGLEQVDPKSTKAKEFMSILSGLDKRCTK